MIRCVQDMHWIKCERLACRKQIQNSENIKGDINKWKDNPWNKKINIVKMFIPSKVISRINAIAIHISMVFFTGT